VTNAAVPEAIRDLGARLAALREAAGYTQASLARLVGYSRSTVANAEAGQGAARHFWEMCDEVLGGTMLCGRFDEIRALRRQQQHEAAAEARRQRHAEAQRWRQGPGRAPAVGELKPQPASAEALTDAAAGMRNQRHLSSWALLAPTLEPRMVDRPADLDTLISLLTSASQPAAAPSLVAVVGPGGFGKTTLATQACHDPRVTGSFPEILWVETGEHCTPARVVQLASDLCVHLGGDRPAFSDPEQAGFHLARIIADRRVLIVIDNVWSAADLAPFLLGGAHAVRLVTTRNARVCPAGALQMRLGPMSAGEVRELLHKTVPALRLEDTVNLAELCSGWPLLASVVGSTVGQDIAAGAQPAEAASAASRVLSSIGPSAFDVWDSDQRANAIGHAITASLHSLEDHVRIPGAANLRDRYLSLAIFPAATPIPLSVLSTWWAQAYGWSPAAVAQFCRVLGDRSLIDAYLADRDAVLLHDVFRAYLRHLISEEWRDLHRSLVTAYRPPAGSGWADLGSEHSYIWRHLPHHLHEAGLADELAGLLASPAYVVKKAAGFGHESLAVDRVTLERADRPDTRVWRTARILTSGARLLHGLTSQRDIAATLLAATLLAARSGGADAAVAESLRHLGDTGGFGVLWAISDGAQGQGHTGAVAAVAAHGDALVTGGEDGIVRIWDLTGIQPVRQRRGHTGWVYAVAISPDGRTIASAGDDAVIRLWRLDTGESTGILTGHLGRIRGLEFTADGRLVSGAEDGQVCLWDTSRPGLIRSMRSPGCPVWAVAVGMSDTVIATAGEDEFVRLYRLDSGDLLAEQAGHRDWIRSLAFSGDTLVSGSGDGRVRVWRVLGRSLSLVRVIETPARVRTVAVSPDAGLIVAAGEDATLRAFTGGGMSGEQLLAAGIDWVRAIAMRPDRSVIAGCEDGSVRLWDGRGVTVLGEGQDTTWSAAFTGGLALLGRVNGTVELRDLASSGLRRSLRAGQGRVWSLAAASGVVAAACGDGSVRVWSLAGDWTLQLNEEERRTWSVALSGNGARLAASSSGGLTRVWDLPSGEKLWEHRTHDGRVRSMAFDDGGSRLLTGGGEGVARLWRLPGGERVAEFAHTGSWVRAVALDSAGSRVALGCGPGDIYVHALADDHDAVELHGHTGRVLMLGFTADPDLLVSAAADGSIRWWSLTGQKQLAEIRTGPSLQTAACDAGSGTVLAASAGGTMAIRFPGVNGGGEQAR
jgi:WD40 repeat protein/transcriptional regulator with XRE-family HTH domain